MSTIHHIRNLKIFAVTLCVLLGGIAHAERTTSLKEWNFFASGKFGIAYTNSKASEIPGSSYNEKLTYPLVVEGDFAFRFWGPLLIGLRYEYWMAQQTYDLSGSSYKETLKVQSFGGELGLRFGNPRAFFVLWGTCHYPTQFSILRETSGKEFIRTGIPYYSVRLDIVTRMSSTLSFILEGGYRFMNQGELTTVDHIPYLNPVDEVNLSGPFGAIGIGFHF